MRINPLILIFLVSLALNVGCNSKRYLPEGRKLYNGTDVELDVPVRKKEKNRLQGEVEQLLYPKPNAKFMWMRVGLWARLRTEQDRGGYVTRFLNKRYGESPVYRTHIDTTRWKELIRNRMENRGFFDAEVRVSEKRKEKTVSFSVKISAGEPYRLDSLFNECDTSGLMGRLISNSLNKTELTRGTTLDLETFKKERTRIADHLRNGGFYFFTSEYLILEIDTNQEKYRKFNAYLRVKRGINPKFLKPARVEDVIVFPQYQVQDTVGQGDTARHKGTEYVFAGPQNYRPDRLDHIILVNPGQEYSLWRQRATTRRLGSFNNFRFVSLRYYEEEKDTTQGQVADTVLPSVIPLRAHIYLSPMERRSIRAELGAVFKSNNFAGPAFEVSYLNRNLQRGGENLNLKTKFALEQQILAGEFTDLTSFEIGLAAEYTIPRLVSPIQVGGVSGYSVPKTRITAEYSLLSRVLFYRLNSWLLAYGFEWQSNRYVRHELRPFNLNFISVGNTTDRFEEILGQNPFLRRSFEQQFILGSSYTWQFNQRVSSEYENPFFARFSIDLSGNIFGAVQRLVGAEEFSLLGQPYAQYVRSDIDLRQSFKLGKKTNFIVRGFFGYGFPHSNSLSLPYIKQYFTGGPNSLRGFRIRSVGTGVYQPSDEINRNFFDQSGDIKAEFNAELRFPMVSVLQGGFFVDAGNVWLHNENPDLPGSQFSGSWFSELAVSAGFGIRVDIEFFVIRLDAGYPLRIPHLPQGQRWTFAPENVESGLFGRQRPVFNFAIGYPF